MFDVIGALGALVVLSPLLLIIFLFSLAAHGRPVLFVQNRPGLHGRPFRLFKFRTMTGHRGEDGELLSDERRITWFGALLRRTSLDELPELVNILRGDMSIVGPRPLLMQYVPLYNEFQKRRQEVRPGLTGWAQVNGRNAISWEQKFELDVWYVDNRSFWLDLKIILMTVWKTMKREGISKEGHATTDYFRGNQ
ncbi:MAG: sugar transferase [Woeseiaceae bacterium]|nr:sugar transferase [Woeseiaceae bacterium]